MRYIYVLDQFFDIIKVIYYVENIILEINIKLLLYNPILGNFWNTCTFPDILCEKCFKNTLCCFWCNSLRFWCFLPWIAQLKGLTSVWFSNASKQKLILKLIFIKLFFVFYLCSSDKVFLAIHAQRGIAKR